MKVLDNSFPSYWTIVRMDRTDKIDVTSKEGNRYLIEIRVPK